MIKTKLLIMKIAELGKRIKDIVIGTEGGEQQKAGSNVWNVAFT